MFLNTRKRDWETFKGFLHIPAQSKKKRKIIKIKECYQNYQTFMFLSPSENKVSFKVKQKKHNDFELAFGPIDIQKQERTTLHRGASL